MIAIKTLTSRTAAFLLLLSTVVVGLASNQVYALESIFGSGPSPLPVEEAFKPTLSDVSADAIQISFDIADEYYLYQKKLSFTTENTSVVLGAPVFPEPLIHEDKYFGKSNVYRGAINISVPVTSATSQTAFTVTVGYQGCADMGLCYPPTKVDFKVQLLAKLAAVQQPKISTADLAAPLTTPSLVSPTNTTAQNAVAPGKIDIKDLFSKKSSFGGADSQPLLRSAEAFVPSIVSAGDGQIEVRWFVEPGYYLYRDKIDFSLLDAGDATVSDFDVDRGVIQNDAYFGDVEILREIVGARIALNNSQNLTNATLQIQSQGCADVGVCFPPETTTLAVKFTNTTSAAGTAMTIEPTPTAVVGQSESASINQSTNQSVSPPTNGSSSDNLPVTEQDKLTQLLEGGHLGLIALAFYVAGVLLAFTACMYPMIPILSSLIVGHGKKLSTAKAFTLSLVYVLSMASVFAVVGILVGLSGYNIQPLFQNPWVLTAFALLFVLLALSMFGLFQLQMPNSVQAKMSEISNKQQSGSYTGVAVMGMLSALIVGPCVTPPLVAALAYIAKTGDATIGGIALFAIGIGMGTPLLFIGTSLGRFMPKAGGWMETTQRIFGVVLLAVAIYLVSRFLPGNVIMVMFAVLAIFTGVYFGATDRLDNTSRGAQRFGKSIGLVVLVYGFVLLIGALAGSTSMLAPLKGVLGQASNGVNSDSNNEHVSFQRIKSTSELESVLAQAKAQNRPVMLDFYADWCISCKEMEALTFPDSRVKKQLRDVILIQADVTKNNDDDKALLKKFGLFGPPAIILYDRTGTELTAGRVVGYMPADTFSAHLQAYLNNPG